MQNKKILLVDDGINILDSFCKDFEWSGYKVTTAASGEEAITNLQKNYFDLLVTDLAMPGVDGVYVLK